MSGRRRLLLGLIGILPHAALSQEVVTLRADGSCRQCRIEIARAIALGDEDGPGTLDHSSSAVVRDSRGNFILRGSYSTNLKVFDRSGRFVRTIGRDGGGPGEFKGVGDFYVLRGDTLAVFDWGTARYSLFSPDHEYLSAGPLPLSPEPGVIALETGEFVFNYAIFSDNETGQPLHRVGRDGKLARSFGAGTGKFRPDVPYFFSRAISPSRGSLLWSALLTNYQIDLIDARSGTTMRSLRRDVDWFPPGMAPIPRGQAGSIEPKPLIFDVVEDSTGLLWVLIGVSDPDWRSAVRPGGDGDHVQVIDDHGYRDTVIEVLDPENGIVLATARIDERVTQFVGPGLVGAVLEDTPDGVPIFQTWTVRLVTRAR